MFRPRIIPCLLLKNGGLVKTVKFRNPTYIGDPINAVKIFNDFEADELVFLDIEASKEQRTIPLELVEKIGDEAFMPFAVGGGIKTMDEIRRILNAGAEKVIINTQAVNEPFFITKAAKIFGRQSLVVSIDVKKNEGEYEILIEGGTKETGLDPLSFAKEMEKKGAGEILINSIDKDGEMDGYDLKLIKKISENITIPVIAIGGAGNFKDFYKAINIAGASAVAAGSFFVYAGKGQGILIDYPDEGEMMEIFKG